MSGIFDRLKRGADDVAHKAEKMARIRRLEGDIEELQKENNTNYEKIGKSVYKNIADNETEDPKINDMIQKITDNLKKISDIEAEIEEVKKEE